MSGTAAGQAATGIAVRRGAVDRILDCQERSGAIPWFEDGPWDPWNHAECVMALMTVGEEAAARAALDHLAATQDSDGSWLAGYGNALPFADRDHIARVAAPVVRDSNFAAYPATALWHAWRITGDPGLVRRYWPTVRAGLDFVLTLQHPCGDVSWSREALGTDADDAVLAGNASICKSLGHGLALAALAGDERPSWRAARAALRAAIVGAPERFDRAGRDRSGFGMDWYYPVLAGVLDPAASRARLSFGRRRFIEPGRGCRCVAHEPWVTVAESAELAIALVGLGHRAEAATLLGWQEAHRDVDGAYWMGWQFAEAIPWPLEKPAWTQAAMILAHDALAGRSRAHDVLSSRD